MRNMPTTTEDGVHVPSLPHNEWNARLAEIAGRPLTVDEQRRADEMARHNWTLRVVASELFGDAIADAHFDAAPRCPVCGGVTTWATEFGTGRRVPMTCDVCHEAVAQQAAEWKEAKYGTDFPDQD